MVAALRVGARGQRRKRVPFNRTLKGDARVNETIYVIDRRVIGLTGFLHISIVL